MGRKGATVASFTSANDAASRFGGPRYQLDTTSAPRKAIIKAALPATSPSMIHAKRKFAKHFRTIAEQESLLSCYLCAMPQDGLHGGTLYLSANWICFYSKMLNRKIKVVIHIPKVMSITQEKTAKIIPNAIRITTDSDSYVFASFVSRNHVYKKLVQMWNNSEEASDSGTSEMDARLPLSEMPDGPVNFVISDSEDVSSESSVPVSARSPAAVEARSSASSMHDAEPGETHSVVPATTCEPSGLPPSLPAARSHDSSRTAVAATARVSSSADHYGWSAAATNGRGQLASWLRCLLGVVTSCSHQSLMVTITIALCVTSMLTMYKVAKLEEFKTGNGMTLPALRHGSGVDGSAAVNADFAKVITAVLDLNLQQLHEIKKALDVLRTVIDSAPYGQRSHGADSDDRL